jgi:outer membrane lipoprotein LolB
VRSGATGWLPPIVVALAVASWVAGCASLPPEPLPADVFSIVGRVAVRYGDEAASGRVTWRHGVATDDLLISSPLGQGIAEITRRDGVYTLVTARAERFTATDPERLTEQALGWALPLAGLPDWVQGRAHPGPGAEPRYHDGRLAELRQLGWTIEYTGYDERGRLPTRMRLTRGDLDIRLAIDEWQRRPE